MQPILEEFHGEEIDEAHDDYQEQVSDARVTLTPLNFDSKSFKEVESTLLIKNEGLIKDIKDCVINVVSEIEEPLSK